MDVGTLLRDVRARAGLTQRALAAAAGTSGAAVAAYETGAKNPRADVALRLVDAAGFELTAYEKRSRSHRLTDLLAQRTADRVAADPSLLDRAVDVLDSGRYRSRYGPAWRHVIAAGPAVVVAVLTSTHPDSYGMKTDSPFTLLGLVPEGERQRLVELAYADRRDAPCGAGSR